MGPAGREGAHLGSIGPVELQPTAAGEHRQPPSELRHPAQPGAASWSTHDRPRGAQLPLVARSWRDEHSTRHAPAALRHGLPRERSEARRCDRGIARQPRLGGPLCPTARAPHGCARAGAEMGRSGSCCVGIGAERPCAG
eukprot:4342397-Pyramimonas_sp.AAC.1